MNGKSKGNGQEVVVFDFHKSNGGFHDTIVEGPSLTRQEFRDECDINTLMAQYDTHVIGGPGNLRPAEPFYADFAAAPSTLLEYMTFMQETEAAFMTLPAVVRREFENDPVRFVEFAGDPENLDQMRAWGMAPPKPADPPSGAPAAGGGSTSSAPGGAPAASSGPPAQGST